ncbi:UDP-glycosyltransferase 87A1-like isoform X2 [Macadamia integrifolia]|uniref:UDP-glycosyltransferase 87A1-like isoform X2 n=1 Tax=Macadamia integrifolia TaxID=60698 RepID=UPI001C4F7F10|nr:UDP-glycosyltransferase 87A1-like isoform X2 [Macadamia integrifolia]
MSLTLSGLARIPACHMVAIPYPGRGHINPIMNACTILASKGLAITFVVTEEWLSLIGSGSAPNISNSRFQSIPNVIPSELNRGSDFTSFVEAVCKKMEAPIDQLLDRIEPPATCIIADSTSGWAVAIGNRRNIPVTLLWPMAPSLFSLRYHYHLLVAHGHLPVPAEKFSERKDEIITYIPGIPAIRFGDLPSIYTRKNEILKRVLEAFSWLTKAQFILFTSFYELQPHVIDTLRGIFPIPIYPLGPSIRFMSLQDTGTPSEASNGNPAVDYFKWLDSQPKNSVLYVSLGSFLPMSATQMHEIAMGLHISGVRYLWVARGEASNLQETCCEMGLVVPWCDQLRVLCHSSVAGFFTHCGWNSILEAIYSGVPMLTFPLLIDQIPNSTLIVEDWKIGLRVKEDTGVENVVGKDEIASVVRRLMGVDEGIELRERAKELQRSCQRAIEKDGSTFTNLLAFIGDLLRITNLEFGNEKT